MSDKSFSHESVGFSSRFSGATLDLDAIEKVSFDSSRNASNFFQNISLKGIGRQKNVQNLKLAIDEQMTPFKQDETSSGPQNALFRDRYDTEPIEILPGLYLGNEKHAQNADLVQRLRVSVVINAAAECSNYFESTLLYKHIPLLHDSDDLDGHLHEVYEIIDKNRGEGKTVLLHCYEGRSRSAALCISYLMRLNNWNYDTAYAYLKALNPLANPHPRLVFQLLEFEKNLPSPRVKS